MTVATDEMWTTMIEGSDELAAELGLDEDAYTRRSLAAVDAWVASHDGPLDENDAARLGFYLARHLVELHDGGLVMIQSKDHPLEGEWAVTGFSRGLANDYHVPFMVSAVRIGVDRNLTARRWYEDLLREGRGPS